MIKRKKLKAILSGLVQEIVRHSNLKVKVAVLSAIRYVNKVKGDSLAEKTNFKATIKRG